MPTTKLAELTPELSLWLQSTAGVMDRHEQVFLDLCRRILEQQYSGDSFNIDHPIRRITTALLNFWFRRSPNDNDGLPSDVGPLLTQVCDTRSAPCRAGRGILVQDLITLFRVAPAWTQTHLLPIFDWSNRIEARTVWGNFLWSISTMWNGLRSSPHAYLPLLAAFKTHFLETARHYSELGSRAEIYATLLTYTALDRADVFTAKELYDAFSSLPPEGLYASAQALVRAQQASGEQREESWRNRIAPFWHDVWPKSHNFNSKRIAELLAHLAIAAGDEFPAAMRELQHWLEPQACPDYTVHLLWESGLCDRYPEEALQLLSAVIEESSSSSGDLEKCLQSIAQAWPDGRHDTRYRRLQEFLRRRPGP
jgi:hypothetical protein